MKFAALKNWLSMGCALVALVTTTASHADKFYYVHNDPLGTPQVITDENKNVVWEVDRDPWGNITNVIVNNLPNNVSLPGQYDDAETGYSDNGWRPYDKKTGQYLQSDPRGILLDFSDPARQVAAMMGIAIPSGRGLGYLNHNYAYANANPVMFIDSKGENIGIVIWGGYVAVATAVAAGEATKAYPTADVDKSRHCMTACLANRYTLGTGFPFIMGFGVLFELVGPGVSDPEDMAANNSGISKSFTDWNKSCEDLCKNNHNCKNN